MGAQLTVLNDRSLGGGSIADGQIELMVNMMMVIVRSKQIVSIVTCFFFESR